MNAQKQNKQFDIQGHRGCRGLLPENTIPAFLKAIDIGVTTLEMDVVISKDKKVVLSHEPFLSHEICYTPDGKEITEATERNYNLYQMTYEEISKCDCGSKLHARFPQQQKMKANKPLLSEVIDAVEKYTKENNLTPLLYNIETKSVASTDNIYHPAPHEFTQLLYDVLKEKGILARTTIQSFDVRTLQIARNIDKSVTLALLVEGVTEEDFPDFKEKIKELGFIPHIYSPDYKLVTPALIQYAKANHMKVLPWTINTAEEMKAIKAMEVDGIITDYPDIAVRELRK